jgi:23S rRNA (uridine2552-2'-O)-methyltransferase
MTYRRKDTHYRRARAAGYRARSAYKLLELDARFRLLQAGDRVVDLGAWPGAWLQVARERVGPDGRLVGVDVVPVDPPPAANVALVTGDVREAATLREVLARLDGTAADVVLSDLAPKLTGVRATDEARAAELVDAALTALASLLRPGGRLLIKVFMDTGYLPTLARLRGMFADVRTTRPTATRHGSAELYAVGFGHRLNP